MKVLHIAALKAILLHIAAGYLAGLVIGYINVFGSSQRAPFICAAFCGIYKAAELLVRHNKAKSGE